MTKLINLADWIVGFFFDEEVSFRDIAPGDWVWIACLPMAGVIAWTMILIGV